jgi:hypothetical protein
VAAWLDNHNHSGVTLDFWHDDNVFIPASLLDILRGEISDEA